MTYEILCICMQKILLTRSQWKWKSLTSQLSNLWRGTRPSPPRLKDQWNYLRGRKGRRCSWTDLMLVRKLNQNWNVLWIFSELCRITEELFFSLLRCCGGRGGGPSPRTTHPSWRGPSRHKKRGQDTGGWRRTRWSTQKRWRRGHGKEPKACGGCCEEGGGGFGWRGSLVQWAAGEPGGRRRKKAERSPAKRRGEVRCGERSSGSECSRCGQSGCGCKSGQSSRCCRETWVFVIVFVVERKINKEKSIIDFVTFDDSSAPAGDDAPAAESKDTADEKMGGKKRKCLRKFS